MHLRNILLAVGVLALVVGVSLTFLWLIERPSLMASSGASAPAKAGLANPQAGEAAEKTILVAAHRIPAGTPLRDEDVDWKGVPAAGLRSDEILREPGSETKFRGALTQRDFTAGEPLLASVLIKPTDRGFLAALLTPGTRAVSIPLEGSQSMSGMIVPTNRVDIILTQIFGEDADPARKSVGETIVRNLRVIAVDQRLGMEVPSAAGTNSASGANTPKMITLEVTERQAEILLVANRLGKVEVAVRAPGYAEAAQDEAPDLVLPTWASDVSPALKNSKRLPAGSAGPAATAGPKAAGPAAAASPAQRPANSTEVMHGSKLETR